MRGQCPLIFGLEPSPHSLVGFDFVIIIMYVCMYVCMFPPRTHRNFNAPFHPEPQTRPSDDNKWARSPAMRTVRGAMHACACSSLGGLMDGWMDGWIDGWMDGRTDGRTDEWMDGWMDEWINV